MSWARRAEGHERNGNGFQWLSIYLLNIFFKRKLNKTTFGTQTKTLTEKYYKEDNREIGRVREREWKPDRDHYQRVSLESGSMTRRHSKVLFLKRIYLYTRAETLGISIIACDTRKGSVVGVAGGQKRE